MWLKELGQRVEKCLLYYIMMYVLRISIHSRITTLNTARTNEALVGTHFILQHEADVQAGWIVVNTVSSIPLPIFLSQFYNSTCRINHRTIF